MSKNCVVIILLWPRILEDCIKISMTPPTSSLPSFWQHKQGHPENGACPSRARAVKALVPLFSDSDLQVPLHFFWSLCSQRLLPVLLCSRSCLDTRGLQVCMLKRSRKWRKLSLHPGWRQLGAPEGTMMEAIEKYLSAWDIQPFPQNVQQTDLSAIISLNLQFIFPVFFCLSVPITYYQPQSENIK